MRQTRIIEVSLGHVTYLAALWRATTITKQRLISADKGVSQSTPLRLMLCGYWSSVSLYSQTFWQTGDYSGQGLWVQELSAYHNNHYR